MPRFDAVFSDEGGDAVPARVELIEAPDAEAAFALARGRAGPHEKLMNVTPVDEAGNVFSLDGPAPEPGGRG